jgi:hypothetical protein
VILYYRQYYATFGVPSIPKAGSFAPPTVNYTSLGTLHSIAASKSAWADYLSPYYYAYVASSLPATRWWVPTPTGVVMSPALITPAYKEQFVLKFSLNTQGPDLLQTTTLVAKYGGSITNQTLKSPGGPLWVDGNSSFTFPSTIQIASGFHRWSLSPLSAVVALAPANLTVLYYEEYPLSVSFSAEGGAAPSPPVLTGNSVGQGFSVQLISGAPPTWVDSGSNYSISKVLLGSSSSERWITEGTASGVANGPTTLNLAYFHQARVGLSYSVSGGGTIGPSSASFFSFGLQRFVPLNATQQRIWADVGSALNVQGLFVGGSAIERWELGRSSTFPITSPAVLSLVYYHQFLVPTVYSVSGGGVPPTPTLNAFAFGAPSSSEVASGSSVWLDGGAPWSVTKFIQSQTAGERWAAVGIVNGTVGAKTFVAVSYERQYLVDLVANPPAGGAPGASSWVSAGGSIAVTENPNAGWAFAGWSGAGGGSYSGKEQSFSLVVSSPVKETANFDVGFVVKVSGSGSVKVSFGSSSYSVGGQLTFYVPPGTIVTLTAEPGLLQSFAGWQGIPAGNVGTAVLTAAHPIGANAAFVLDNVEALGLTALSLGVGIYLIAYLVWNKHLSPRQLWHSLRRKVTSYG